MKEPRIGWKSLVEILGIAGLIASLVFVAWEIRQNTDAVRSASIQGVLDQSLAANLVPVDNDSLREAIYTLPEDLSDDQRRQLGWFYSALLRLQLNRFSQSELGVLSEAEVLALGARGGVYQTASFEDFWSNQGGRYSPEFEQYIESLMYDSEIDTSYTESRPTQRSSD